MVVRSRLRAIVTPVLFYVLAGVASTYFVYAAVNGERGLKTKDAYRKQIGELSLQLAQLKTDRAQWQHRIDLMRSSAIDEDLLDEQARSRLDYVDPRDLVIFNQTSGLSSPTN